MSADATRGYPGMELGVVLMLGPAGLTPPELGRAVEDSLFCAEHTHIPVDSTRADGRPVRLHADTLDPFVVLSAAAAVTSGIKLGTGACLVIERDPITLAKEVASLDRLSGGRFLFGVGAAGTGRKWPITAPIRGPGWRCWPTGSRARPVRPLPPAKRWMVSHCEPVTGAGQPAGWTGARELPGGIWEQSLGG